MGGRRPDEQGAGDGGALLAYEVHGGRWGWCYRDAANDFELHSNGTFATREEAVISARRAYPDVPFAADAERHPGG